MKDVRLIHLSSKITLSSRIVILLSIFILTQYGGYLPQDAKALYLTFTPLTVFLFAAYIRFAIKYPYPVPREEMKNEKQFISPLLITYIMSLGFIVLSALKPDLLSFASLQLILVGIESILAIHTAFTLPQLFARFPLQ